MIFLAVIVLVMAAAFPAFAGGSSSRASTATGTTTSTPSNVPATLTITGLDAYNGLRITAETWDDIFAAADIVDFVEPMGMASIAIGGVIENGTVILPVWETSMELNADEGVYDVVKKRYTGSGPLDFFVRIWEGSEVFYFGSSGTGQLTVTFNNGKAESVAVIEPTPKFDDD
jgi:hypothetical protein